MFHFNLSIYSGFAVRVMQRMNANTEMLVTRIDVVMVCVLIYWSWFMDGSRYRNVHTYERSTTLAMYYSNVICLRIISIPAQS